MTKEKGYVSFVLHAHLPFIHHPESEDYLEEQWLYEAISETYIPLLLNFKKLEEEKVDFRITMSLTPPLLNMLDNKLLQKRYIKYLKTHIELCEKGTIGMDYNFVTLTACGPLAPSMTSYSTSAPSSRVLKPSIFRPV